MDNRRKVTVIVPFYNEQESLTELGKRLTSVFDANDTVGWEALLIDDGSTDASPVIAERLRRDDSRFHVVTLSRNFGKEAAMLAGFDRASGDAAVIIDADLQHPPEIIPLMVEKWLEGYDDVYGRRHEGTGGKVARTIATRLFYRVLSAVSEVKVGENIGDFRLLDRVCIDALKTMREQNRYTKGMYDYIGFKKCGVEFNQEPRRAGRGKMRFSRLFNLAVTGIVSSSTAPLRWLRWLTAILLAATVAALCIPEGRGLTALILAIGTLQTGALSMIGEYIGRISIESSRRPPYIISEIDGVKV